jgi:5'-phosphate synthase pdxT subunit
VVTVGAGEPSGARIGVLALQGGFAAHAAALAAIGDHPVEVREAAALAPAAGLQGLVLPGGESTTMVNLIDRFALRPALEAFVRSGRPVLATCAGLILAARQVSRPAQPSFGWLDVAVIRNAWGRQLDSFEALADDGSTPLVFIRAPRIVEVGAAVQVLATAGGEPVLVRQGNVTGATFHPELTRDRRIHQAVFHPLAAAPGARAGADAGWGSG